jgi:hypothetical protein
MKLLTFSNSKTRKGEKLGYKTFVLHLAPNTLNSYGKNLCPMATKGCIKGCLNTAGFGGIYPSVQKSRMDKSDFYISNRVDFLNTLYEDIIKSIQMAEKQNFIPVYRLNGTSDIQWENIIIKDNKNIFELFPQLNFYDYTKIVKRFEKKLPENYHLTFSYSQEEDYYKNIDTISIDLLKRNVSVAVIFRKNLPESYLGFPVTDGDENDLRFKQDGVIIGLKAKGRARKDVSGFVVDL